jgi:ferredoxin
VIGDKKELLFSLITYHHHLSLVKEKSVADPTDRVGENVLGTYYVDTQCIDCDVCRDTAPDNFTRSDENGYSFVCKQPETEDERALCEEALAACPVEAIGNDG